MHVIKRFLTMAFGVLIMIQSLAAPMTYGPIKNGEKLWEIAAKVRPAPSITRYQAIIALQKANPQAFGVPCDINSLKVGQTLFIPSMTEMQVIDSKEAEQEYHRQTDNWKKARQQKQKVLCTAVSPTNVLGTETEESMLSVIKTAFSTTTPEPVSVNQVSSKIAKTDQIINSPLSKETETTEFPQLTWWEQLSSRLTNPPVWLIIGGGTVLVLSLLLLISWLIKRRSLKSSVTRPSPSELEREQWHFGEEVAVKTGLTEDRMNFSGPIEMANSSVVDKSKPTEEIKEKLAYLRTYLAEGEEKAVQRLLKEVVEKGTTEQQEEAQQLIEISKKMSTLELQVTKTPAVAAVNSSEINNSSWQTVIQTGQQVSLQQYLPDNETKIFDLIDKIFELLDGELNAQGKLVEAYVNRHRLQFLETRDYTVVNKPEKVVMTTVLQEDVSISPRTPPRTTRYL